MDTDRKVYGHSINPYTGTATAAESQGSIEEDVTIQAFLVKASKTKKHLGPADRIDVLLS